MENPKGFLAIVSTRFQNTMFCKQYGRPGDDEFVMLQE